MHPIRLPIAGGVLFLAILFCGAIFLGSGNAFASTSVVSPTPVPTANAMTDPPGASAITPSIQQKSVSTVGTTPSPTYTANDVRQFINTYGFVGGPVVPGATLTITSIQFITASQASQLLGGEDIGRNSTQLVCYVVVKGPFNVINMSLPPTVSGKVSMIRQSGVMVFDAYTGNLLIWAA
jgi:hypothetical protein